jgi:hypothetical protein
MNMDSKTKTGLKMMQQGAYIKHKQGMRNAPVKTNNSNTYRTLERLM